MREELRPPLPHASHARPPPPSPRDRLCGLLLYLALVAPAPAPASAAITLAPVTGTPKTKIRIADQNPAVFDDERLRDLGFGYARRSVAWDALRHANQRADLDAWVAGASLMGAEPLITLARSRRTTGRRYRPPSDARYLHEFRRLRKRYPTVKTWSAWNEANMCGVGGLRQARARRPVLHPDPPQLPRLHGPRSRSSRPAEHGQLVQAFRRAARFEPKYWGLHAYIDANRFQTTRSASLLRAVRGEVWLTEIGGRVARRNDSEVEPPQGKAHATRATRFIFDRLARLDRRVARIYVYHWRSSTRRDSWDSALIGADNRPRPALAVVRRALRQTTEARNGNP